MDVSQDPDAKMQALKQTGTLNPHPNQVTLPLFQDSEFFDPQDLLQVKYEMLRQVSQEGKSIRQASADLGFSRPALYQAQAAFQRDGLAGLVPHKRGPKSGHKLTEEVLDFVEDQIESDPHLTTVALVELLADHFGLSIHRRSLERALNRRKKKLGSDS